MFSFRDQRFMLTYPLPYLLEENKYADYSYLEELYPVTIKAYQVRVKEAVDLLDYPGSVIYDEYPDALTLYRTAKRISDDIELNEALTQKIDQEIECSIQKNEKECGPCKLIELIQVLLYVEIQKRRMAGNHDLGSGILMPDYRKELYGSALSKDILQASAQNEVEKMEKTIYNKE